MKFETIAAIPKAVVWKRAWPVAWSSAGSRRAIVRTVATRIEAKATPVNSRVAMMRSGTVSHVHDAKQATLIIVPATKTVRRPTRSTTRPSTNIDGISASAETPAERATSDGCPPSWVR